MFRFTIRDVLWLTAVVAMAVAWGIDRNLQSLKQDDLRMQLLEVIAKKEIPFVIDKAGEVHVDTKRHYPGK
jgi:hypothetical protein